MTYNQFIQNILNERGRFGCSDGYCERHHIVPRCMGGSNEDDNLIDLYAYEHFIAHKLLSEENPENHSLQYAFFMMANCTSKNIGRYKCTPEEYEEIRSRIAATPIDESTRQKMSDAKKGKKFSVEHRAHMALARTGRKHSEETKRKISESQKNRPPHPAYFKGHHHTEETKRLFSQQRKGRDAGGKNPNAKKVVCEGMLFDFIGACAKFYNIKTTTMTSWLNGHSKMPQMWKDRGLAYA